MSLGKFNPEMLVLARDLRGMTQKEVADASKLSQAFVSHLEAGTRESTDESESRLANALRLPLEFFRQDEHYNGLGISMVYYRKRNSALICHLKRLQGEVNLRRMHIKQLLRGVNLQTSKQFSFMDIDENGTPEDVAIRLRAAWLIPLGPIANLTTTIENAGGFVFKFLFGTTDIDAMSQWPNDSPPLFFLNSLAPSDRTRFSLAHELGHILMHQTVTDDIESEADRFASEFLMPRQEIGSQLLDIDLKKAASLKPYWRCSMAALIRRARDLGKITESRYRDLFIQMSKLGYRKSEPSPIAPEEPKLVPALLNSYTKQSDFTLDELAKILKWPADELHTRYFPTTGLRLAQ
jgi:Zn-dependent peptidase ImmA (M78 family)/transcriptional regulator with XRE-family HTH domain